MKDKLSISELKKFINLELEKFTNNIINTKEQSKKLENNLEFLQWLNRTLKLKEGDIPDVVRKREIFYCEFGVNIGSEQRYKRPCVILQNDFGNTTNDTVIVAPITTYEHSNIVEKGNEIYVKVTRNGEETLKRMDFYNILVELEERRSQDITGFINVIHMREVSKKRLALRPVAKITNENFLLVQNAIIKNLDFDIDKTE